MLDPEMLRPERIRPLLRCEYEQLVEQGIFEEEHVELLRGVLVEMSPQGFSHARISAWFAQQLSKLLDIARYDVRAHSPFAATADSMPEPDISVARRTADGYHPRHASLLIEISVSSTRKDRLIKSAIYAEAGVPEYWIVDVDRLSVEILTGPTARGYARSRLVTRGVLAPIRLRGVKLAVARVPWLPRDPVPKQPPRRSVSAAGAAGRRPLPRRRRRKAA
jgi:Uma2 family endonuclease